MNAISSVKYEMGTPAESAKLPAGKPAQGRAEPDSPPESKVTTESVQKVEPLRPLHEVVDGASAKLQEANTQLSFHVDESSGRTVIKIVDQETGEVLKEIPPEKMRELASRIEKALQDPVEAKGVLLREHA